VLVLVSFRVADLPYARPFLTLLVFHVLANLAANTFGQYGTYMMANVAGEPVNVLPTVNIYGNVFGILLTFVFMRVVDGPARMRWFYVGAGFGVAAMVVPAVLGVTFVTLVAAQFMLYFMFAFAFEPIMEVWAQESFPTLLRSTAQGDDHRGRPLRCRSARGAHPLDRPARSPVPVRVPQRRRHGRLHHRRPDVPQPPHDRVRRDRCCPHPVATA
jgi:hypothetical protein